MALIDSHCHLDFPVFDDDRDVVVQRARDVGVTGILVPGVAPATWGRVLAVRERYGGMIRVALGLHPHALPALSEAQVDAGLAGLAHRLLAEDACAVGECGLDGLLVKRGVPWERQEAVLSAQLTVARRLDLPVVLHCVKAHGRLLALLEAGGPIAGVVHAWTGSAEMTARFAALGLHFGFGGAITRANARRPLEAAAAAPADRVLLETDAPDMAPRGAAFALPVPGRNEPMMVAAFAARLRELRGAPLHDNSALFGFVGADTDAS